MVALSRIGSVGLVWLVLAAIAALVCRRPAVLVLIVAAVASADLSSSALKHLIGRDRPPLRYPEPDPLVRVPHDHSFPSGHAATSFACAALLAWSTRLPALPLYCLAALIAFSRVYVGVHYPLDVVGGACLGLLVATALRLLAASRLRLRPARPAD